MLKIFDRYKSRLYPVLAVADQALQSLVNLLSNILLIRYASREEYGIYGVGFTSILLILGLSHALFGLQMTVIAPDKPEKDRKIYFGSMFISMIFVVSVLCAITLLIVASSHGWISEDYRKLITVVAISLPGMLVMQFMRQCLYFFNQAHRVLLFDLIFFLLFFGALSFLVSLGVEHLHLWALLVNGGTALMLGLTALWLNLRVNISKSMAIAKASFTEAWRSGSWALLGSVLTVLQTQGYVYLLAIFKGPTAVAEMNAARLFLSPLLVMSSGFSKVMIPRMALLKADGHINRAVALAMKIMFMLMVLLLLYLGLIAVGWGWFSDYLSGKGYENLWMLVVLWGCYFLSNVIVTTPSELLQVFREFRLLTLTGMVVALMVLSASLPAIIYFGTVGAMLVLIAGEIGLAILLWARFRRVKSQALSEF